MSRAGSINVMNGSSTAVPTATNPARGAEYGEERASEYAVTRIDKCDRIATATTAPSSDSAIRGLNTIAAKGG